MTSATHENPTLNLRLTAEQIFLEYGERVHNLARRLLDSHTDADDVTQDVFVQVLRKLPTFRGEAAFSTWLYRVAVNAALSYRRKRATRRVYRLAKLREDSRDDGTRHASVRRRLAEPERLALDKETYRIIEEASARLPRIYRDVHVLSHVAELPNTKIADMLGLSLSAVKSRLHRSRLLMRKALSAHFAEHAA